MKKLRVQFLHDIFITITWHLIDVYIFWEGAVLILSTLDNINILYKYPSLLIIGKIVSINRSSKLRVDCDFQGHDTSNLPHRIAVRMLYVAHAKTIRKIFGTHTCLRNSLWIWLSDHHLRLLILSVTYFSKLFVLSVLVHSIVLFELSSFSNRFWYQVRRPCWHAWLVEEEEHMP